MTVNLNTDIPVYIAELGTSLFQIAQLLFALEQTILSGAKELLNKMSEERWASWKQLYFEWSAHERFKEKEMTKTRSEFNYWTVKISRDGKYPVPWWYCEPEFLEIEIQFI